MVATSAKTLCPSILALAARRRRWSSSDELQISHDGYDSVHR